MNVDGKPTLTCKQPVEGYGDELVVEPLSNFPVIRDLVVEFEGFLDKLRQVKPWIIRAKERAVEEGPLRQTPEELERFKQFSYCINCMLCYAACPVVANEPAFLGPAAIALGHRYNLDSRDQGQHQRNAVFREDGGVFACSYAQECSNVCPKHVDPSGAIQQAKLGNVIDWVTGLVLRRGNAS
jgi:fumarate reductase iron-sulfur subunit